MCFLPLSPKPGGCKPRGRTACGPGPAGRGRYFPLFGSRWLPPARQGSPATHRGGRGCRPRREGRAQRGGAGFPLVEVGDFLPIGCLTLSGGVALGWFLVSLWSSGSDELGGAARATGCRWGRALPAVVTGPPGAAPAGRRGWSRAWALRWSRRRRAAGESGAEVPPCLQRLAGEAGAAGVCTAGERRSPGGGFSVKPLQKDGRGGCLYRKA